MFTPELLDAVYGTNGITGGMLTEGGYKSYPSGDEAAYLWNAGIVQVYEGAAGFYLPNETQDPWGNSVTVTFDSYRIAPISTLDAVGNTSSAVIDYRTMSPSKLTDANGNCSEAITDPAGLVIATSIYGTEQGVDRGDMPLSGYTVQSPPSVRHVVDNPATYLQSATTFFYYDVNAWIDRAEPPQAVGLTRETHVRDLGQGQSTKVQAGVTCSDGFGREIQSKLMVEAGQAWVKELIAPGEPGYVEGEDNYRFVEQNVAERWLSSGRTVFNNKEKPVKQYEPFYTATEAYEPEQFFATHGVTPVIHYDPLLRVVRTDTPKGFHSKVEFDPWTVTSYDTNDTVTDSDYYTENYDLSGFDADEKAALTKAAAHADTPGIAKL
ncbi:MAG: sugar-binding protein, partial [Propionibacteriaceae bacterium]|nr:sugar-binding protein [Propionibacteriaceae bacterium]